MVFSYPNNFSNVKKKTSETQKRREENLPTCGHAAGPTQKGTKKWTPQLLTKNGEQPHLDLHNWDGFFMRAKTVGRWLTPLIRCFFFAADSCWRSVIASRCITCEGTILLRIWCACSKFLGTKLGFQLLQNLQPQYLMRVLVFSSQRVDFTSCLLFPAQSFMSKEEAVHIK